MAYGITAEAATPEEIFPTGTLPGRTRQAVAVFFGIYPEDGVIPVVAGKIRLIVRGHTALPEFLQDSPLTIASGDTGADVAFGKTAITLPSFGGQFVQYGLYIRCRK